VRRWGLLFTLILLAACTGNASTDSSTTSVATTVPPTQTTTTLQVPVSTVDRLEQLGGEPCPDSDFTCVTIDMPYDHADPSAPGSTIGVTFAVLPATGERRGVFVTAVGGPGGSGISVADSYTSAIDPAIPESFDIVFWDQRGIGLSGHLNCPTAAGVYYRVDASTGYGVDHETLATASKDFVSSCLTEMGSPDILPYLGTSQAVADLEAFRQTMGYEDMTLYGESYGTQVAQEYAATFGDHLAGLILDGTVDLTLDSFGFFEQQAAAFGEVLDDTLSYCGDDPLCSDDFGGVNATDVYDRLTALLSEGPMAAEFPLPNGELESRSFGIGDLEVVASGQMYGEDDRMLLLRALAAYQRDSDLAPMLRLLYQNLGADPSDEAVLDDPTYSDAMYYGVECLDYAYPGTTADEKADAFFDAGSASDGNHLGIIFYGDLPCAYWPVSPSDGNRPDALTASGIPTVVLGASSDPATPYQQGVAVSGRLEEGYLISQSGGPHVIFGRGNSCPDDAVNAFILDGTPPDVTVCDGDTVGYYIPLLPTSIGDFEDPESMFDAIEYDITYTPEYWWWDGVTDTSIGCSAGGSMVISATDTGDAYQFDHCALIDDLVISGSGGYEYDEDDFHLDVTLGSEDCAYTYRRTSDDYSVDDNCPGGQFAG
jgi:pimeloyl-ACP methyl ester carboxylesterase